MTQEHPATKADEIALVIEEAIVTGELAPGTVLRQEQLSEEFGVSRTPIREALRILVGLELVSVEPRRGVRVRSVSREDLRGAFLVRAELEALAAELALPKLTDAHLATATTAAAQFADLTAQLRATQLHEDERRTLATRWVEANDRFHDVVLDAANVEFLARSARASRRVFHGQTLWLHTPEIDALYRENLEQHQAILAALQRRDIAVRTLLKEHVLASGLLLDALLERALRTGRLDFAQRVSWNDRDDRRLRADS